LWAFTTDSNDPQLTLVLPDQKVAPIVPIVKATELQDKVQRIYELNGVSREEAAVVSRHQVGANLAGHDTHGAFRTKQYVTAIKKGDIVPGAPFEIERETESTAVVNGNWGFGFVQTERAMAMVIDKAKRTGTSAITIRFQGHVGRLGGYTAQAADADLIAIMFSDSGRGPKLTAPFGGTTALLGTNPICIAVPSERHGAVILDMATSAVALGKVQLARQRGDSIPLGWIIDSNGQPTTDPNDYWKDGGGALLPLGGDQGHKGYGLAFMVEVFCGLLTGLGYGVAADGKHNDGNFIAGYDVARFMDPGEFKAQMSDFIDYLKAGAPAGAEVLFPGEMEQRTAKARLSEGIWIEEKTWDELVEFDSATTPAGG
jgi:LDH2 family malate/lactate/ureidoglycolate dehydrogenase